MPALASVSHAGPPPVPASVTVETIGELEGFRDLREEWTGLLAASDADNLFLSWEWLYTWWTHLAGSRRLFLLAARSEGELIGLAPLAVTPGRRASLAPLSSLAFLGTGSVGSDYLDLIAARGREVEARNALAAHLCGQPRALALSNVRRTSSAAAALVEHLAGRGWRCAERPTDVCPFIPLHGLSWASYLSSLTAHHRSNFRRRLGNLERAFDVRFERADSEAARAVALDVLLDLHRRRWHGRGGSTAFYSDALRAFHHAWSQVALDCGWLRLFALRLDGHPVGAIYGFRYRETFGFYQIGFDPAYARHGVGQVMVGLAIKSAIEEGAAEFDFLHGDERYKFDWARQVRELAHLQAYAPGARGRIHGRLAALDGRARRLVHRALDGIGRGSHR
jgi:CelD/BcsL family acetyltransferase involved in cellulose biosynthesis